jgi:acetyl-CoA carboxylase biotin carboxyl carrier protein
MPLSDDDVREILRLIDESDVEELRVETAGLSLYVRREAGGAPAKAAELGPEMPPEPESEPETGSEAEVSAASDGDLVAIRAPMLGTFYRAQAPGRAPFVEIGGRVEADTVVCLIEVMKMMNPVPAGVAGTVVEVCAENAELVEHETLLFKVRQDA